MKNITWSKSASTETNELGIIKMGMIVSVDDKLAIGLEKSGFRITESKPTHEKKDGLWVEIKKEKGGK